MMSRRWRSRSERKMKGWPLMMMMVVVRVRGQAVVVVERETRRWLEDDGRWCCECRSEERDVGGNRGMVVNGDGQTTTVDDSRRERSGGRLVGDERESKKRGRERREEKETCLKFCVHLS